MKSHSPPPTPYPLPPTPSTTHPRALQLIVGFGIAVAGVALVWLVLVSAVIVYKCHRGEVHFRKQSPGCQVKISCLRREKLRESSKRYAATWNTRCERVCLASRDQDQKTHVPPCNIYVIKVISGQNHYYSHSEAHYKQSVLTAMTGYAIFPLWRLSVFPFLLVHNFDILKHAHTWTVLPSCDTRRTMITVITQYSQPPTHPCVITM